MYHLNYYFYNLNYKTCINNFIILKTNEIFYFFKTGIAFICGNKEFINFCKHINDELFVSMSVY